MISDEFVIYLLFQMIILVINLIGFVRIPVLSFFAIIFEITILVQTVLGFGDYYVFAVNIAAMNLTLPIYSLSRYRKG
jgi:hypothetical protein